MIYVTGNRFSILQRMAFFAVSFFMCIHVAAQDSAISGIRAVMADVPSGFLSFKGNELPCQCGFYSRSDIEGTSENQIYSFHDFGTSIFPGYYLARIAVSARKLDWRKLGKWEKTIQKMAGSDFRRQSYTFRNKVLGDGKGTRWSNDEMTIQVYYQRDPKSKLYFIYLTIGARQDTDR